MFPVTSMCPQTALLPSVPERRGRPRWGVGGQW